MLSNAGAACLRPAAAATSSDDEENATMFCFGAAPRRTECAAAEAEDDVDAALPDEWSG